TSTSEILSVWQSRFTEDLGDSLSRDIPGLESTNVVGSARSGTLLLGLPGAPVDLQLLVGAVGAAIAAVQVLFEGTKLAQRIVNSARSASNSTNVPFHGGHILIWPANIQGRASASPGAAVVGPDVYFFDGRGRVTSVVRQSMASQANGGAAV